MLWITRPSESKLRTLVFFFAPSVGGRYGVQAWFLYFKKKIHIICFFPVIFLYGQVSRTGQMEQTVKLTSCKPEGCFENIIVSPQTLRTCQQVLGLANKQKTEIKKKWPYSVCGRRHV